MNTNNEHEELLTVADHNFLCLFQRQSGGGFQVSCPDLPSMSASGKTLTVARTNIHDEIGGWLEVVRPD